MTPTMMIVQDGGVFYIVDTDDELKETVTLRDDVGDSDLSAATRLRMVFTDTVMPQLETKYNCPLVWA